MAVSRAKNVMRSADEVENNHASAPLRARAKGSGQQSRPHEEPGRSEFRSFDAGSATFEDTKLGFLMHDITRLRRAALDQIMKTFGVTRAQWWVIAHLSRHDGMMQVQLASLLDIGKASLGNLVERLEASGLIARRFDPTDKRAKRVYLTRASRQLIDQLHSIEAEFNEMALHGLSRDDRRQMLSFLTLIKANMLKATDPKVKGS